ncbi:MAG: hypothetical protein AB7O80_14100 [Acetobacteraceae bacterium]
MLDTQTVAPDRKDIRRIARLLELALMVGVVGITTLTAWSTLGSALMERLLAIATKL